MKTRTDPDLEILLNFITSGDGQIQKTTIHTLLRPETTGDGDDDNKYLPSPLCLILPGPHKTMSASQKYLLPITLTTINIPANRMVKLLKRNVGEYAGGGSISEGRCWGGWAMKHLSTATRWGIPSDANPKGYWPQTTLTSLVPFAKIKFWQTYQNCYTMSMFCN